MKWCCERGCCEGCGAVKGASRYKGGDAVKGGGTVKGFAAQGVLSITGSGIITLPPPGQHQLFGQQAGDTHPTGMLSCFTHFMK